MATNYIQVPIRIGNGAIAKYIGARAYVEKIGNEARITCVDKDGKTIAVIRDGIDGINGTNGIDGKNGIGIVDISTTDDNRLRIVMSNGTVWESQSTIKGEQGERGEQGVSASFNQVTVTIDGGVGEPSVDITKEDVIDPETGEPIEGEFNLAFAFHNIKGERGEDGATYDDTEIRGEISQLSESITEISDVISEGASEKDEEIETTIVTGHYLRASDGYKGQSANDGYTLINVSQGEIYKVSCFIVGARGICLFNDNTFVDGFDAAEIGLNKLTDYEITIPSGCNVLGVCSYNIATNPITIKKFSSSRIYYDFKSMEEDIGNNKKAIDGINNALEIPSAVTNDVVPASNVRTDIVTEYDLKKGHKYVISYNSTNEFANTGYIYILKSDGTIISSKNVVIGSTEFEFEYTSNDDYEQAKLAFYIYNNSVGASVRLSIIDITNKNIIDSMINEPFSTVLKNMVKGMSYKSFGELSKGYICLSCDDGYSQLATYTIPMLISKDVPCTFNIWYHAKNNIPSQVLSNDAYRTIVLDAVNSHGCEIGQHGNERWAKDEEQNGFTERELNEFFDSEKEYWDSIGVDVKSACCPAHKNDELVRAVCGNRFGIVRSGYDYVDNHYDFYTSGARSNLYGLSSVNVNSFTLANHKSAIDYVKANNKVYMLYWHDWDLNDLQKATLESVIDYAKEQGLQFVTMSELLTIL